MPDFFIVFIYLFFNPFHKVWMCCIKCQSDAQTFLALMWQDVWKVKAFEYFCYSLDFLFPNIKFIAEIKAVYSDHSPFWTDCGIMGHTKVSSVCTYHVIEVQCFHISNKSCFWWVWTLQTCLLCCLSLCSVCCLWSSLHRTFGSVGPFSPAGQMGFGLKALLIIQHISSRLNLSFGINFFNISICHIQREIVWINNASIAPTASLWKEASSALMQGISWTSLWLLFIHPVQTAWWYA